MSKYKKFAINIIIVIFAFGIGYYSSMKKVDSLKPVLTTAGVVHVCPENKIVLIERGKAPKGVAMFGGHVEYNEALEVAFRRELLEELNISEISDLQLLGVHGDPGRDPRQHSVEVTYSCVTNQSPKAGSDAKSVKLYSSQDILNLTDSGFAFDHGKILKQYLVNLGDYNPCN
ncbi:MAG: NUDIX hydrolase [Rickettsiales bacterium]|jgi:8-oxo-dGTP diphosphatase|nr:NUDIX hydrolase [Rickettsiales bacterium]